MRYESEKIVFPDGTEINSGYQTDKAILSFPDLASATTAALSLPDGQTIDVVSQEKRYIVQAGTIIFRGNLDQLRLDLINPEKGAKEVIYTDGYTVADAIDHAPYYVDTFSQLSSIPIERLVNGRIILVSMGLRAGKFYYTTDNISSRITRDPGQGIFIPHSNDPSGSGGGFVRSYSGGTVQAVWFGVTTSVGTDNTAAIRNAIYGSVLYEPTRADSSPSIEFPAGRVEWHQNNLFGELNFSNLGATYSFAEGLKIFGQGRRGTTLYCVTGGTQKWLYDSLSTMRQLLLDIDFVDLAISSDDPENFSFAQMYSTGIDKRFRATRCLIQVGSMYSLHGTGNADLHRTFECDIRAYKSLVEYHNNQSVSVEYLNCDIQLFRDMVILGQEGGGSFRHIGGNTEMHAHPTDTSDHFLFRGVGSVGAAGMGLGNCDFISRDVRFEIHGINKKGFISDLFSTVRPVIYSMFSCQFGAVSGGSREFVLNRNHNTVVKFDNCILHDSMTFRAVASTSDGAGASNTPVGAHIYFEDCVTGSGSANLASRCTKTGNRVRIRANGCYPLGSSIAATKTSDDFDFGWMDGAEHRNLPATAKIVSMASGASYVQINPTARGVIRLPPSCFIRRVSVKKVSGTGSESFQLKVGNYANNVVLASSAVGTVSSINGLTLEDTFNSTFGELNLWAETTSTATTAWYCIIEYI